MFWFPGQERARKGVVGICKDVSRYRAGIRNDVFHAKSFGSGSWTGQEKVGVCVYIEGNCKDVPYKSKFFAPETDAVSFVLVQQICVVVQLVHRGKAHRAAQSVLHQL